MNKLGKYLFILVIVLLISIGGVYASDDNQSSTVGVTADDADDLVTVDTSVADEGKVVDVDDAVVQNQTVKTVEETDNPEKSVGESKLMAGASDDTSVGASDESEDNLLKASSDKEVLGATQQVTGTDYSSLSTAVSNARAGDTINIQNDISTSWGVASNTNIQITKSNLIFEGNGKSLNPSASVYRRDGRSFYITSNAHDITFNNIRFINGEYIGSGVYINSGSNIKFVGCTFSGNHATSGSAVYIGSNCKNITFEGCTFSSNYASSSGGAIYVSSGSEINLIGTNFNGNYISSGRSNLYGGAIYATECTINITGCTFIANRIESNENYYRSGGVIYINSATKVSISNSGFTNNRVTNTNTGENSRCYGGAIAFWETSNNVEIIGCNFANNRATGNTGQANRVGGAISFYGAMDYLLVKDCNFTENKASRDGGAVMFSTDVSNIHFVDSTFTNNSAFYGGALMFNSDVSDSDVAGCTFTHNTAENHEGGAIDYYNNVHNLTISSTFTNNIASKSGSAIAMDKTGATFSDIKIINSMFKDHTSTNGTIFIRHNPGTLIIENTTFENNNVTCEKSGATVYFPEVDNLYVLNSEFINNNAPNGAVLYVISNNNNGVFNFEDSNFTNNHATSGSAGALYLSVNGVNIDNCNFDDNSANANGGAIFLQNTEVNYFNIVDSTFERNTVVGSGAAIYYNHGTYGQTVTPVSTISNLTNCNFISNSATADVGGAFLASVNKMVVSYCNFTDNSGNANGGGLIFGSPNGIVTQCNFNGNTAHYGAGLYTDDYLSYATGMSITYCNFTDNNANNNGSGLYVQYTRSVSGRITDFNNNHFTSNVAGDNGGAIYWDPYDDFDITDGIFVNNTAGISGGAIYFDKAITNIGFNHTDFINNHAATDAGGVYTKDGTGTINVDSCNFSDNSAGRYGGSLVCQADNNIIYNCTFDDGYAQQGGAIYLSSSAGYAKIDKCNFTNNKATVYGTPNGCDGGAIRWEATSGFINNSNFIGNSAEGYAGAIDWNSASDFSMHNSTFIDNTAQIGGGVFFRQPVTNIEFTQCNFTGNNATSDYGGAIYTQNGNALTINTCNFTSNYAEGSAGAILTLMDKITFSKSVFDDNEANQYAGAIGSYNSYTFDIADSTFTNNKVNTGFGGALLVYNGDVVNINKCNFSDNGASTYGGSVYVNNAEMTVNNSSFDNSVAGSGGAIYCDGPNPKIYSSNFTNNNATDVDYGYGGAVYLTGDNAVVSNSHFNNNRANSYGGALAIVGTNADVAYCDFTSNSAEQSGGAVYINNGAISNSNFTDNSGKVYGGAVYWKGDGASITHSEFKDNTIENGQSGGAIFIDGNYGSIGYSNFVNNSASSAGAIYLLGSSHIVSNSNFTNNHVTMNGAAVYIEGNGNEVLTSTFTNNSADRYGGAIFIDGSNSKIISDNFVNNTASVNGNTIWVESGSSNNISKSNFTGVKHIYINGGSTTLMMNKEISDIPNEYMVYNKGTLSLYTNTFNNIIYNTGKIITPTYANVTNNKTYENWTEWSFPTFAHVYDDNNNTIVSVAFTYRGYVNNVEECNSVASDDIWHNGTLSVKMFTYLVSADDAGLDDLTVYTSIIKVASRPGSYTWLQEIIDNLNGNELVLSQNVTFNDTYDRHQNNPYWIRGIDFKNGMLYNKTFTLNGNDSYISGDNGARIFTVSVSDIKIDNITFVNGSADNGGALLFNIESPNIQITNSNFTDNNARVSGGAIYFTIQSDNISIEDSTFDSNTAPEGGAITFFKGASNDLYRTIDIVRSNFTNNRATIHYRFYESMSCIFCS